MPNSLLRSLLAQRFVRFLMVGAFNTAFGYGVFYVLLLANLQAEVALLVSTIAGVIFNFLTTSRLVFRNSDPGLLRSFATVYIGMYIINAGALRLAIMSGVSAALAQACLLPVMTVITYLALRKFVFAGRKN